MTFHFMTCFFYSNSTSLDGIEAVENKIVCCYVEHCSFEWIVVVSNKFCGFLAASVLLNDFSILPFSGSF